MRNLIVTLCSSFMLFLAAISGSQESAPAPDRKVYVIEYMMRQAQVSCIVDTVTTHADVLQPALGPVAPASLVAVDGGTAYLALIRSMTFPANRRRELVSLLGNMKQENDKHHIHPKRPR